MHKNQNCLHIGCGLNAPEGWINIDASLSLRLAKIPILGRYIISVLGGPAWPISVKYGDIVKGIKIKEDSCELVFSAHVLEHLSLSNFHAAVSNIYSYLKPGGVFRAIVPDLEKYIATYITHRSNSSLSIKAAHEFMSVSFIGHPGSRSGLYWRLREAFSNSRHQWMWDEPSLVDAFYQHGFKDIRRCDYGEWSDARFGTVEQASNHFYAICVEGTK
jgi:SAM-dependent methyltransferase